MSERRATINDVAEAAGVSRGTVSRVLNRSPRVSPEARKAVEKAIKKTNYKANPHARSLASGRNDAIAVLLTRPNPQLFEDPTFSLMLQGISDGLVGTELSLILLIAGNEDERRRAARFIDPTHVDGVIHMSPLIDDPMVEDISDAQVPVVVCGQPTLHRHPQRLWSVTTTDKEGAMQATRHLVDQGARHLAMIAGPPEAAGSQERIAGYREVLGAGFSADLVEHGDYGRDSGRVAMQRLLDRRPDLDAVFCASDRMALGAMEMLRYRGLHVPDDVLLVGFDDHEISRTCQPALTTVHQPIRQIGRAAVQMMVSALAGDDPGNRIFPTQLKVRESSRTSLPQGFDTR